MMFWIVVGLAAVFPVIIKAADHVVRRMERIAMHLVDNDPDDDYEPLWVKGVMAVVMIVIPLAVGNIYFFTRENKCGWSELDALWMTFVTMTTVGYGDLALCDKEQDQLFVTVFAIFSVVWSRAPSARSAIYTRRTIGKTGKPRCWRPSTWT